eukprot:jgi/Botrbrau1/8954/Bobra.0148s0067.1
MPRSLLSEDHSRKALPLRASDYQKEDHCTLSTPPTSPILALLVAEQVQPKMQVFSDVVGAVQVVVLFPLLL